MSKHLETVCLALAVTIAFPGTPAIPFPTQAEDRVFKVCTGKVDFPPDYEPNFDRKFDDGSGVIYNFGKDEWGLFIKWHLEPQWDYFMEGLTEKGFCQIA